MDKNTKKINLTYSITDDEYISVLKFQMELKNSKNRIVKIVPNLIFLVVAIAFIFMKKDADVLIRFSPLIMALILNIITISTITNNDQRARKLLTKYKKQGIISKDYFSIHTMQVTQDRIAISYKGAHNEAKLVDISRIDIYKNIVMLISNGVVFEIIPKDVVDEHGSLTEMISLIESAKSQAEVIFEEKIFSEKVPENCIKSVKYTISFDEYISSMIKSYRLFYTTKQAWMGSQIINIIIFIFGVYALFSNIYIGLAFIAVGLYLNRQLIVTFTPLCRNILVRTVLSTQSMASSRVASQYTLTDTTIQIVNRFTANKVRYSDIQSIRKDKDNIYLYTKEKNMLLIFKKVVSYDDIINKVC